MIIEGEFFFNGMPRWNLGWVTPNYAGAFLAMLLPWLWIWRTGWDSLNRRLASIALLALEALGWFLLCKTYSRGALVAAVAAVLWWVGLRVIGKRQQASRVLAETGARLAVVTLLLLLTGFIGRVAPAYTQADESIGNRLDLWRGGLEMLASSPWRGWGAGESGRAYMNWFQPIGDTDIFTTMVNSYLHVGVEHGLPVLFGVLTILCAALTLGWQKASKGDVWAGAASASLLAWGVANVFTTLWIEPKLWIVPGVAIAVSIWRCSTSLKGVTGAENSAKAYWRTSAVCGIGAAVAISLFLYAAGLGLAKRHSWKVAPEGYRATALLSRTENDTPEAWHVWPDPAVFGPTPGQELRRWTESRALELHVYLSTDRKLSDYAMTGGLILSGNQAERLGHDPLPVGIQQLWILHPSSSPPPSTYVASPRAVVVLPAIDETGLGAGWKKWAADTKARVIVTENSGADLRAAWPKMAPQRTDT